MWRFKPFTAKEPAGLEGRVLDVGNVKIQVQNAIAEGGFSCVYLARDAVNLSRQYALKHMICQDCESLDLAVKEISVMKLLKGHPNVVTLVAHTMLDMGRRKEVLLVMEFCEKSLVTVLESRGSGYFDEKQVLLLFRDVCNAVFAMHCQSPPIAHRDLKVENILLGSDGAWKLCDFGSTTTNHKCFDRPEEMGIEEDNIRKYTTPAYRAPEMWDLYRREVISEKVDIWALGCLLYRICYFKLAFDGESKLQILNGNYRIPELPKYSASLTSLIKDMLESSPDARPDITQVWFRVNCLLPVESQKDLPDGSVSSSAIGMHSPASNEGAAKRTAVMPRRSPPPPPSSREQTHKISPQSERDVQHSRPSRVNAKVTSAGDSLGAFWSTQHALDSQVLEKGPIFDEEPICQLTPKHNQTYSERRKSVHGDTSKGPSNSSGDDFEIRFSPEKKPLQTETKAAFNAFAADSNTANNTYKNGRLGKVEELEAEVISLREQLKQANLEKTEITSKYDKLSAICRSQRQELQELKRILAASTPSPSSRDSHKNLDGQLSRQELKRNLAAPTPSPSSRDSPKTPDNPPREREKIEGTVWELQQGIFESSPSSPDSHPWQAFPEEPKRQNATPISVKTANGFQDSPIDEWGFGQDNFRAAPTSNYEASMVRSAQGSTSHRFGGSETTSKLDASQPAGWAGF